MIFILKKKNKNKIMSIPLPKKSAIYINNNDIDYNKYSFPKKNITINFRSLY